MGKNKKAKLSSITVNNSEKISENTHPMKHLGMASSKKKQKSEKSDASMQSTLNSYISTSNPKTKMVEKKMKQKLNSNKESKTKLSPKKQNIQAPSMESSSDESSDEDIDHSISKKRKSKDAQKSTAKKIKLSNNNANHNRNAQLNTLNEKVLHSEDHESSSPDMFNSSKSQEKVSNLAPKSSVKRENNNFSSDEGLDWGDEEDHEKKNEENQLETGDDRDVQEPEIYNGVDWSKEQTEELIFMVQENISGVTPSDTKSFRIRMKNLSFGNVPGLLHPPRSEDECMDQLRHIVESTKSVRNLSEMLRAYKHKPLRKNIIITPFRRFMMENKEEIQKMEGNLIINARAAFAALPEEERQPYRDAYQAEINSKIQLKPKSGRSTFKIFCDSLPNASVKEQKEAFLSQTLEQKLALIKLALKEHKQAMKQYDILCEKSPGSNVKPPVNHILKDEWKIFLESKGMPLLRVTSPYQLYQLERGHADDSSTNAKSGLMHYNKLARSGKLVEHEESFKKEVEEFSSKFKAWFTTLKNEYLRKQAHAYYTEMTTSKGGIRKSRTINLTTKIASKVQELEQSYVESTMVGKFPDEPASLALTAKDVLRMFVKEQNKKRGPNLPKIDFNGVWAKLDKESMAKCVNSATQNIAKYKESLKEYVKTLSDHERRVYIGQNRVRFIRVFEGTDIFENDYPCSQYPPFKIQSKTDKKSPQKNAKKNKLDIDITSMLKPSARNDSDKTNESEDELDQDRDKILSEESFKDRLPSTSTPGTIFKKHSAAVKQKISTKQNEREEDSESSYDDSDDDEVNGAGNNSTRYLDGGPKVHSKKLMEEVHNGSQDSSEEEDDEEEEEEEAAPKPTEMAKSGRSPAPAQMTRTQFAVSASVSSSSSEEETSSSDEGLPITKMSNSPAKVSPHLKAPQPQLSKMQATSSGRSAVTPSNLVKYSPKAVKVQSDSSSESSDSEEEPPSQKKSIVKSALERKKTSHPPVESDSSSDEDDDDIQSAWC